MPRHRDCLEDKPGEVSATQLEELFNARVRDLKEAGFSGYLLDELERVVGQLVRAAA